MDTRSIEYMTKYQIEIWGSEYVRFYHEKSIWITYDHNLWYNKKRLTRKVKNYVPRPIRIHFLKEYIILFLYSFWQSGLCSGHSLSFQRLLGSFPDGERAKSEVWRWASLFDEGKGHVYLDPQHLQPLQQHSAQPLSQLQAPPQLLAGKRAK